ncbi:hypothetical protein [Candidatus Nitrospira bockiana]
MLGFNKSLLRLNRTRSVGIGAVILTAGAVVGGTAWWEARYDDAPEQVVPLTAFSSAEYPEDPEDRSAVFGNYPHRRLRIERLAETRVRFVLEPASPHSTTIELPDVDLAHFVAAVPPWAKSDADLTKIGLIDREWNRQQVQFSRDAFVQVHDGGDGFEQHRLSRVDLARNCLNAGLWELLLFTTEDGMERVYEHVWFTFPLGLYKHLFERVNGLSYWDHWWSLEHWVDPAGTPVRLDRIRTVEQERPVAPDVRWHEPPAARGEQALKRRNILAPPVYTYRDWYAQPVRFASFIPPGRYSVAHPRETKLQYLADLTGAVLRRVRMPGHPQPLVEIELVFRNSDTGEVSRLIFGGLDLDKLPLTTPESYERGWQAPMGIANPSFFERYEDLVAVPPAGRTFYGFHLDAHHRWIDHHAVGVDGPLLHRDARDPATLHLYLLSYERHALLNHVVLACPADLCGRP